MTKRSTASTPRSRTHRAITSRACVLCDAPLSGIKALCLSCEKRAAEIREQAARLEAHGLLRVVAAPATAPAAADADVAELEADHRLAEARARRFRRALADIASAAPSLDRDALVSIALRGLGPDGAEDQAPARGRRRAS